MHPEYSMEKNYQRNFKVAVSAILNISILNQVNSQLVFYANRSQLKYASMNVPAKVYSLSLSLSLSPSLSPSPPPPSLSLSLSLSLCCICQYWILKRKSREILESKAHACFTHFTSSSWCTSVVHICETCLISWCFYLFIFFCLTASIEHIAQCKFVWSSWYHQVSSLEESSSCGHFWQGEGIDYHIQWQMWCPSLTEVLAGAEPPYWLSTMAMAASILCLPLNLLLSPVRTSRQVVPLLF